MFQHAWKVILVTPTFRIRPERSVEFALFEALRDIIVEEQDHEIDLKDVVGLRRRSIFETL